MNKSRLMIVIALLAATIVVSYAMPKKKYQSLDILSKVEMPYKMIGWQSKDVSQQFNPNDMRYNFIKKMLARAYWNSYGESLVFMILDAGNFHNPKVCYGSSGYTFKDLAETEFEVGGKKFKAITVLFQKGTEETLVIYWLVINKEIVNWTQQKFIEFWYSFTGKQKAGLMVRIEVSVRSGKIDDALKLAKGFVGDVGRKFSNEELEYVFGK